MNPITFDEWGAQEAYLFCATENGGNAPQVLQYREQNQCVHDAATERGSARWTFIITTSNQKAPEIISRLKQF